MDPKVPRAASAPPDLSQCDFCDSTSGARWVYQCPDFTQTMTDAQAAVIHRIRFIGPWRACKRCHLLIEADEWPALLDRSLRLYNASHPGAPLHVEGPARSELAAVWLRFRALRTGPATRAA